MNGWLLGLKRLLVSWGYDKSHVRAYLEMFTLHAGDEEIVKIVDGKPVWYEKWSEWAACMSDEGLKELVTKFEELMGKGGGKVKGKIS